MHNAQGPSRKIGVLVALERGRRRRAEPLGKQLAMHIAAAFQQALDADSLTRVIERSGVAAGRPETASRQSRPRWPTARSEYAKENAPLSQLLVMDNKTRSRMSSRKGGRGRDVPGLRRFQPGEGIEKEAATAAELRRPSPANSRIRDRGR